MKEGSEGQPQPCEKQVTYNRGRELFKKIQYTLYSLFMAYMVGRFAYHGRDFADHLRAVNTYGYSPNLPGYCSPEPLSEYPKSLFSSPNRYINPIYPNSEKDILPSTTLEEVYGTTIRYPQGIKISLGGQIDDIPIFRFLKEQRTIGKEATLDIVIIKQPFVRMKYLPDDIQQVFAPEIERYREIEQQLEEEIYQEVRNSDAEVKYLEKQRECATRDLARKTPSASKTWQAELAVINARINFLKKAMEAADNEQNRDMVLNDPYRTRGILGTFIKREGADGTPQKPFKYLVIVAAGTGGSQTWPDLNHPVNLLQLLFSPFPLNNEITNSLDPFDFLRTSNMPVYPPNGPSGLDDLPFDIGRVLGHELNHYNENDPNKITPHPVPDLKVIEQWQKAASNYQISGSPSGYYIFIENGFFPGMKRE